MRQLTSLTSTVTLNIVNIRSAVQLLGFSVCPYKCFSVINTQCAKKEFKLKYIFINICI